MKRVTITLSGLLILLHGRGGIDIRQARMHFAVQPPARSIRAEVTYTFVAQDSLLVWDMGKALELLSLQASFPLRSMERDTGAQTLTLVAEAPLRGARHTLTVRYAGEPASSGFGSFEVRPHETGYVLWTLSQPYGARDWLFGQDNLADKIDTLFISVETPPEYLGVANGRLLADSLTAQGTRIRHFQHNYPIATYLIAIAASNYVAQTYTVTTPFHSYTLINYVFPQDTARARLLTEQFWPYFSWIEEKIGPYPFADEGYHQVQIGWGGGMEHQTITFFGSYSLELWAHELAHQWFGDLVTCGSWQDIWLNEAFATLLGGKVYEVLPTGLWPLWRSLTIKAAWRDTASTIFVEDTTDIWRIFSYPTTYAKGALALETLRDYLNDEPFWKGLRQFLADYRYGFARTADFARSVRPHWGSSITETFLQSWIFTPGYPGLSLLWEGPGRFTAYPRRPYPMRVLLKLSSLASNQSTETSVSLMEPTPVTATQPIHRVFVDPDTITPYYVSRYFLAPPNPQLVFPNPTSQTLYILSSEGPLQLSLWDARGQLILRQPTAESYSALSLPALGEGLYYLTIETPTFTSCKKVIYTGQ